VSGTLSGAEIDLASVRGEEADSGVSLGAELLAYTDAVMANDAAAIASTREVVQAKLGPAGVVDTAAVMAMFNVVDRVADATGITIDEANRDMRYAVGSELAMDHLTPEQRAAR
jgi:hypothetical protein